MGRYYENEIIWVYLSEDVFCRTLNMLFWSIF